MNFIRLFAGISLLYSPAHAEPWTSSRELGSPQPPPAFVSEQVFASIALSNVTDMVPVPGSGQWLIAENKGKIWCVPNDHGAQHLSWSYDAVK